MAGLLFSFEQGNTEKNNSGQRLLTREDPEILFKILNFNDIDIFSCRLVPLSNNTFCVFSSVCF